MIDPRNRDLPAAWQAPAGAPIAVLDELRELLSRYHIPEKDAVALLEESLFDVLYKIPDEALRGPAALCALEAACRSYWENRRWRTPDVSGERCGGPMGPVGRTTKAASGGIERAPVPRATVHRFDPGTAAEPRPSRPGGRGLWADLAETWKTWRTGSRSLLRSLVSPRDGEDVRR